MIGIDLFSGAGGMSTGAKAAGVQVAFSIEMNRHAAASFQLNHPGVPVIVDDIRKITEIPTINRSAPTVLFGGPPCQGFSTSNQRTRSLDNPANWLYQEFMRFVNWIRPDFVVFENVKGIAETDGGSFLSQILAEFHRSGYCTEHGVLNSVQFGVPQRRSRLFIIASREMHVQLPVPNAGRYVTVQEAIADLPELKNGASVSELPYQKPPHSEYAKMMRRGLNKSSNHLVTNNAPYVINRYKHIPPGGNWRDIPEELMSNYADRTRCHTGIYRRLSWDEPSVVIGNYRKNMLIHPSEHRGLSVREAARLQSFPDSYAFSGTVGIQQQQVGNAVPPLLAEAIFRTLQSSVVKQKNAA